jgi:hypothetical protein
MCTTPRLQVSFSLLRERNGSNLIAPFPTREQKSHVYPAATQLQFDVFRDRCRELNYLIFGNDCRKYQIKADYG